MKTPIQELIEFMNNDQVSFTEWFLDNYQSFIDKEKKEIEKAFDIGFDRGHECGRNHNWHEGENQGYEYYEQTFK